jgi:hypothetical protein
MTKNRGYLIFAAVLAALVVVLGFFTLLPAQPGVTKANFDRIEKGMTRAEVEAIFGGPGEPPHGMHGPPVFMMKGPDNASVIVEFDIGGAAEKHWFPTDETFADKMRRWLHLAK